MLYLNCWFIIFSKVFLWFTNPLIGTMESSSVQQWSLKPLRLLSTRARWMGDWRWICFSFYRGLKLSFKAPSPSLVHTILIPHSRSPCNHLSIISCQEIMHDPFAMRPFFGYNFGHYLDHWLSMKNAKNAQLPKVFHVNWFRKGDDGKFLWPGEWGGEVA